MLLQPSLQLNKGAEQQNEAGESPRRSRDMGQVVSPCQRACSQVHDGRLRESGQRCMTSTQRPPLGIMNYSDGRIRQQA